MNHCNNDFEPYEIWYLKDIKPKNETFTNRMLRLGICPVCKCTVVELIEMRMRDGKIFPNTYAKKEALHVIELNKDKILHSFWDIRAGKKAKVTMPRTIRYGENKLVKVGNVLKVRQRAVDFYGNKELLREV